MARFRISLNAEKSKCYFEISWKIQSDGLRFQEFAVKSRGPASRSSIGDQSTSSDYSAIRDDRVLVDNDDPVMDGIALYVKDTALRIQIICLFHVYLHAEAIR